MLVLLYDLRWSKNSICIRLVRSGMGVIRVPGAVGSIVLGIIAGSCIFGLGCRGLGGLCCRFCLGIFDCFSWILIFLICSILGPNSSLTPHILVGKLCIFKYVVIILNAIVLGSFDFSDKFALQCYNCILGTDWDLSSMWYDIFSCTWDNLIHSNYSIPFSDISYISSTSHSYPQYYTNTKNKSPIADFIYDYDHYHDL